MTICRLRLVAGAICSCLPLLVPGIASAGGGSLEPTLGTAVPASPAKADGTMGMAARRAVQQGYLVPDQAAYDAAKAAGLQGGGAGGGADTVAGTLAPVVTRGWLGIDDSTVAYPDSTSAVGTTRYIELVNRKFAIYNKASDVPIATGPLRTLSGLGTANVFFPQMIWDPQTRRFYYAMDAIVSAADNRIAFGWSKTASPDNASTDFCHYEIDYNDFFPDFPRLGDTRDFLLFGVNTFTGGGTSMGSDVIGVGKPGAGAVCPDSSTFPFGFEQDIRYEGDSRVFSPVPANQTDSSGAGWIVTGSIGFPSNFLGLLRVTRDPTTGNPVFETPVSRGVPVPLHTAPADAPQKGSAVLLDTLDGRLTQAVSGIDPGQADKVGIWTQHTVAGPGGRAAIRWYEIDPIARIVLQSGTASSPTLFNFNGAISPDRAVNGTVKSGGDGMVLGFNSSGTTGAGKAGFPQVRMISKVGAGAQSGQRVVRNSPGPYIGSGCAGSPVTCRWGSYSGATPDPNPPGANNQVWLVSEYASAGTSTSRANWRTWNWVATP